MTPDRLEGIAPPADLAGEYVEVAELTDNWETHWKPSHAAEAGDKLYVRRALIATQPTAPQERSDG